MFPKPQSRKAGRPGRPRPSLAAGGLLMLMLASPLLAQTDFDTNAIFQAPAGPAPTRAPGPAGPAPSPALPPSATDPFNLPPVGSIPLGLDGPPLTSPSSSAPEFQDDPFGTPAPEDRQVRQVGAAVEQPAAKTPAPATPAPAAPLAEPDPVYVPPEARQTLDEAQRARLRALFPDMLPPEEQTVSALTPSAAPADPDAPPPPEQTEPDGAAIGRAGSLLTKEFYGQAKILPPLELPLNQEDDGPPAAPALPPNAKDGAPSAQTQPAAKVPAASPAKAQPAAGPAKAQPPLPAPVALLPVANPKAQATAAPAAPQPAAQPKPAPPAAKAKESPAGKSASPVARGSLALVNETGDPQVGAVYQSALSRLGYTVLAGPAGGFRGGPTGQTVIYYRPGAQTRAQAVSRDLPGRKTLAEAPAGTSSDIVVVLR